MKNFDDQTIKKTLNDIHLQIQYNNQSEAILQCAISLLYSLLSYFMFYNIIILDMFPTIFNYEPEVGSLISGIFILGIYNLITYHISVSKHIRYLKYENNQNIKNVLIFIPVASFIVSFFWFVCDFFDDSIYKNNKKELIESITPKEYLYLISKKEELSVNESLVLETEILPALKRSTEYNENEMFLKFLNKKHKTKCISQKTILS